MGLYDPLQPIPYIVDLTRTGLMTIGWDRTMVPPGNYTVIPSAQVAVRSWDNLLEDTVNDSRRR